MLPRAWKTSWGHRKRERSRATSVSTNLHRKEVMSAPDQYAHVLDRMKRQTFQLALERGDDRVEHDSTRLVRSTT